jgi:iron complex outermembrane receptor protein
MHPRHGRSLMCLVACMSLASRVHGETAPNQSVGAQLESSQLEEIVVTAQKRNEDIESVGATITAVSGTELIEAGIRQPVDIAAVTPGLSTLNMTADGTPIFAVRGIGLDDFNPNNSSGTAVYVDGVYQSAPAFLEGQLFDVARVEVLKGPQGTLYGKNATGGAVSIVSSGPDNSGGYITAGIGRWGTFTLRGADTQRLTDTLAARLAFTATDQTEGWQTDINTGRHYGQTRQGAVRAMLEFKPVDWASAVLTIHGNWDRSIPSSYQADEQSIPGCATCSALLDTGTTDPSLVKVSPLLDMRREINGYGESLTTNVHLGFADLVSILAYDANNRYNVDNNNGVPYFVYSLYQKEYARQAYEETRLTSSQPLLGLTDWLIGTSYSWQEFHGQDRSDQSVPIDGTLVTPPDLTLMGASVARDNFIQKPTSYGLFLNTTTHLTSALRLNLGGRYSDDNIHVNGASYLVGSDVNFGPVVVAARNESQESRSFSYRAGLEFDLSKSILAYFSTATATKSGQYYLAPALDPAGWQYTRPEKLTAYELGLKTVLLDRRLIFNSSIFYYDYKDRQSGVLFLDPATGFLAGSLTNIPGAHVTGLDMDFTARPLSGLTLNGAFSYLHTWVTQTIVDVNGDPLFSQLPVGSPLAQAPRFTETLGGTYQRDVGNGITASIHLNNRWVDSQKNTLADPLGAYGPFSQLNGRFALNWTNGWELALWGRNLTNSNSIINAYSGFLGRTIYRMQPISYGAEVTVRF